MRWKDLLLESQYDQMLQALVPLSKGVKGMENVIDPKMGSVVSTAFRRKDRVIWYMRWFRIQVISQLNQFNKDENVAVKIEKLMRQYLGQLSLDIDSYHSELATFEARSISFRHFANMTESPEIQSIVWDKQLPSDLIRELYAAEAIWVKKRDQVISYDSQDDQPTIFLDLGNGWAWYDLETPTCTREASAMGHCGNAGGESGQTILSLRKSVGDHKLRPSLTFILHEDGTLGEMKGRENNTPSEKHHDAIVALLKDPRIKGITGGGYKPENNFRMSDLKRAQKDEVTALNPMLRDTDQLYYHWIKLGSPHDGDGALLMKRIHDGIREKLDEFGYSPEKIDLVKDCIVVESYDSPENYMDIYHGYTYLLKELLSKKLPDLIERKYTIRSNKAHNITHACARKYFTGMFEELLSYDCDFILSDTMHFQMIDGKLVLELPLEDFMVEFFEEDHSQKPQDLAEVSEDDSPSLEHLIEDTRDPVEKELLEYLQSVADARNRTEKYGTVNWPKPSDDLITVVYEHFKNTEDESYTQPNLNQFQLDLGDVQSPFARPAKMQ